MASLLHSTRLALSILLLVVIPPLLGGCAGSSTSASENSATGTATKRERPNIIFVFTDDHATHAISAYGSQINETPNIDRLAEEGMLFRNAFVANSICAPSRAAILTGKFGHKNGIRDNGSQFDGSQMTFPKLLQDAGYQTAIVGKWHLRSDPTGFDYWEVLPGQGTYYNPDFRTPRGRVEHEGYVTSVITDLTLDWLKNKRNEDKPFMLMYQHKAPHRNWLPGPDHVDMYDDETIPEPETLFDDYQGRTGAAQEQEMMIDEHLREGADLKIPGGEAWNRVTNQMSEKQLDRLKEAYADENKTYDRLEGRELTRWKYQRYIKDYLRTIASVDDNLGRVLDYLDQSGLAENTVVIYSSDQGFFLGDHGWFDKRWMYEESLKMPFIVRWPGVIEPTTENNDLVQNIDFAETFLDMAGVKIPDAMQGRSLVPLMKGQTPSDWREAIYYQYFEYPRWHRVAPHYGVRTQRYKLIHYPMVNEWELFDLVKDPDELKSVYGAPGYQGVQERLKEKLDQLRDRYDAPPTSAFQRE